MSKKYFCKVCNKKPICRETYYYGKGMCNSCSCKGRKHTKKTRDKISKNNKGKHPHDGKDNPFFGKTHTKKNRKIISEANKYPKGNMIVKHHIYLKENSNEIMILKQNKHNSLHYQAYRYLVDTNQVKNYINWFDKKYSLL